MDYYCFSIKDIFSTNIYNMLVAKFFPSTARMQIRKIHLRQRELVKKENWEMT